MNTVELVKKISWRDTFRKIEEAGEYTFDIVAADANNVRSTVSLLNSEGFKFRLTVKFVENTAIITAEDGNNNMV